MQRTESIDKFFRDAEKRGFIVDEGRHADSLYARDLPDVCVGTVRYGELVLGCCPSLASDRAILRNLANKYGFSVTSGSAVGSIELGPNADYLR